MCQRLRELMKYSLAAFFFIFVAAFTVIDMIMPQRNFSDLENTYLQKKPAFDLQSFYSGEFIPKYEKYINDQFAFRDKWISLKSRAEYYSGKLENNGIVYGSDGYMFDKVMTVNTEQLARNVKNIGLFLDQFSDTNVSLMLIPGSFEILKEKLPSGLNLIDQKSIIEEIYASYTQNNVKKIDLFDILNEHSNEYIYYKTDHHWTTLGAYYAYKSYAEASSIEPVDLSELKSEKVDYFLGTYYSKSKLFNASPDYINYYDLDIEDMTFSGKSYDSMYEREKFKKRDKYSAFLYGNNDVTVIKSKTDNKSTKRILVVKDSYGNSFVPFLTANYDEIYVVDLRSNSIAMSELMSEHKFDDVLVMYSLINLCDDVNIVKIKY